MPQSRCGAPTQGGTACRFPADRCPHEGHARARETPSRQSPSREAPSAPLRTRDLRALGWWLIEEALAGRITPPEVSAVNRMMHTILQLGPAPESDERALQEVALRGLLMHGMPPRTRDEWRRAAEIFDDEALAEFRRWPPLASAAPEREDETAGDRVS